MGHAFSSLAHNTVQETRIIISHKRQLNICFHFQNVTSSFNKRIIASLNVYLSLLSLASLLLSLAIFSLKYKCQLKINKVIFQLDSADLYNVTGYVFIKISWSPLCSFTLSLSSTLNPIFMKTKR